MRIVLLTALFTCAFYAKPFLWDTQGPLTDTVKVKASAPERPERLLTAPVEEKGAGVDAASDFAEEGTEEGPEETSQDSAGRQAGREVSSSASGELAQITEEAPEPKEEGWELEMKDTLARLEPEEGAQMYQSYRNEQQVFQEQLDELLLEKQQKSSQKSIREMEQIINQLEQRHQQKLQDILGVHYGTLKDQQNAHLESNEVDVEEE